MFSFDLRRLYYGAVAFLVFVLAFLTAQSLIDGVLRLVVASNVPLAERSGPPPPIPTPLPPPTPVAVVGQPTPVPEATLTPDQRALHEDKERARMPDWELYNAKASLASTLAIVLVSTPLWWWHWRRWRAATRTGWAQFFRLYGYAVMLVALVTAVFRSAGAIGKIVLWLLGVADLSTRLAMLTFVREFVAGVLGALLALLAWWYHWVQVREGEAR